MKEITDKLDFVKIKGLGVSKDPFETVKRQAIEWENICANHRAEKGFISKTDEELTQVNLQIPN